MSIPDFVAYARSLAGRKSRRIAELEADVDARDALLAASIEVAQNLQRRCNSLAADLKRAQNHLLGLCSRCEVNVHLDHTPEDGCPDPGCVCRVRDSDPTEATT